MGHDRHDPAAFRLSAADARLIERKKEREKRRLAKAEEEKNGTSDGKGKGKRKGEGKGKGKATAIEIPSSPSVISVSSDSDEDEFEEVAIPGEAAAEGPQPEQEESYLTEEEDDTVIRLEIGGKTAEEKAKELELAMRKKPMTAKDRAIRMEIHKMHVVCLLASARIRNSWASDDVLKARLLSLLPHQLHAALTISPKRFPDRAQRSRLFYEALQNLVTWWHDAFFDISDETLGQRTRTWDDVQEVIDRLPAVDKWELKGGKWASRYVQVNSGKGKEREGTKKKKEKEQMDPMMEALTDEFGGERLRSVNSMMKKALQQEGSRDVSAQLFVSLARACGLGARLVVSVQAVPWRAEKTPAKKNGAGRGGRTVASRQGMGTDKVSDEDDMEEVPIPGSSPVPAKNAPQAVGSKSRRLKKDSLAAQPPVFWAEVFSRSDQRWVPVDPVKAIVRKKAQYDPASESGPVRMAYVVAYEEDGYARDVTLRYAKNFGARTCKMRPPARPGEEEWWPRIVQFLQRPQRLNRDDLEDAELEMTQGNEAMPLVMTGFKDHPLYVLERHLKMNEVILPKREIGRFKGEAVYRRSNVLACKTAETWMRVGRQVKPRQEPLKWIKQRAVTIQKRRAQELAIQEGQEPLQQGLYAEYQTELYKPPPIKDGIIPQNAFGNIDLYTPSMLPEGAVHLPYKGIAKVARQLKLSFAEAVTSFEFRKQKATPVITGIVVAKENEDTVLEAYWESAAAAEEKEKARRETAALKRWAKLINGMRVRNRLRAEYGNGEELHERAANPMATELGARTATSIIAAANQESAANWRSAVMDRMGDEYEEKPDISDDESVAEMRPVAPAIPPTPPQLRIKLRLNPTPTPAEPPDVQVPEPTQSGRPKRGVSNGSVNANAASGSTPKPTAIPKAKVTAKAKAAPKAKPTPKGSKARGKGRKRKAESESEASESDNEVAVAAPAAPTSAKGKRAAAPVPAPTRTLRSRAAKTEAQQQAEEVKRNRIKEALDSEDDE